MVTATERIEAKLSETSQPDISRENPLRVEEVAALFKVHRRTVENWFARGLWFFRIGRIRFTTREAISRFARPCEAASRSSTDAELLRESMEARELMRTRFGFQCRAVAVEVTFPFWSQGDANG